MFIAGLLISAAVSQAERSVPRRSMNTMSDVFRVSARQQLSVTHPDQRWSHAGTSWTQRLQAFLVTHEVAHWGGDREEGQSKAATLSGRGSIPYRSATPRTSSCSKQMLVRCHQTSTFTSFLPTSLCNLMLFFCTWFGLHHHLHLYWKLLTIRGIKNKREEEAFQLKRIRYHACGDRKTHLSHH